MPDIFFLIVGIILTLINLLILALKIKVRISCSRRIEAIITDVETETTYIRGSTLYNYRPKYQYTVDGQTYTELAPLSTVKQKKYNVGDTFVIYIDPSNPELARIPRFDWLVLFSCLMLAFGVLLIVSYFL